MDRQLPGRTLHRRRPRKQFIVKGLSWIALFEWSRPKVKRAKSTEDHARSSLRAPAHDGVKRMGIFRGNDPPGIETDSITWWAVGYVTRERGRHAFLLLRVRYPGNAGQPRLEDWVINWSLSTGSFRQRNRAGETLHNSHPKFCDDGTFYTPSEKTNSHSPANILAAPTAIR